MLVFANIICTIFEIYYKDKIHVSAVAGIPCARPSFISIRLLPSFFLPTSSTNFFPNLSFRVQFNKIVYYSFCNRRTLSTVDIFYVTSEGGFPFSLRFA